MDKETIIKNGQRIEASFSNNSHAAVFEAIEFLRVYAGERSSFYKNISKINTAEIYKASVVDSAHNCLKGFINYVENDLHEGISLERKIQLETVSDILEQANILINNSEIHPGAPAIIAGAALEEFLRNWAEESEIKITGKPGIDNYAKGLREIDLINKQDYKDITSWAGLRNDATHGKWDEVNDKKRIIIMLEAINLFIRKYTK